MDDKQLWKPWGHYIDIHRPDDKNIVLKQIVVDPDGQLSNQYHKNRTEFWYIVSGEGVITVENFDLYVTDGDHLTIKPMEKHMVKNIGVEPLVIYETQVGQCEEDDIIRLSDKYGRGYITDE